MLSILTDSTNTIYTLEIPEHIADEDVAAYTGRLTELVMAEQPFGCIFHYLGGPPKKSKRGHAIENAWLKTHKAAMSKSCFGLVIVESPGMQAMLRKLVFPKVGPAFFGCPCAQFHTDEEAHAWLYAQQRKHGGASMERQF